MILPKGGKKIVGSSEGKKEEKQARKNGQKGGESVALLQRQNQDG